MGTGFYGSNDPTNSVKALKEQASSANLNYESQICDLYHEGPQRRFTVSAVMT